MARIDNLELVKLLFNNARMSYVDLARHFNVSETAVRKKIKALEQNKTILRYMAEYDPRKLGFMSSAILGIDTEPNQYVRVGARLREKDEILHLFLTSGSNMLMSLCFFRDLGHLNDFVEELEAMPGVTGVCVTHVADKLK